jgi:hypothetical protein
MKLHNRAKAHTSDFDLPASGYGDVSVGSTNDYDYNGDYNYDDFNSTDYGYDDYSYDNYDNYTDYNYDDFNYDDYTDDYSYDDWNYDNYSSYDDYGYESDPETLVYEAREKLNQAISIWESMYYDSYDSHDDDYDNHTDYYSPACPGNGAFQWMSFWNLQTLVESGINNGTTEYGYWEFYDDNFGATFYGNHYADIDQGWASDGENYLYYQGDGGDDYTGTMYDCNWTLRQTWGIATDPVVINEAFDEQVHVIGQVKTLFNLGFHYYYDDGTVSFNDVDYWNSGIHYPDGSGYVWLYSDNADSYTQVEYQCNLASGTWTVYGNGYDDDGNFSYEITDSGSWDFGCENYTAMGDLTVGGEISEDAAESNFADELNTDFDAEAQAEAEVVES